MVTTEYRLPKVGMIEFGVMGDEGRADLGSRIDNFVSPGPSARIFWEAKEFVRNDFTSPNASVRFF